MTPPTAAPVRDVEALRTGTPYDSYCYAYPHKTAYRPLDPPRPLTEVWAAEPRNALFLYAHVPFCAVRCGFCNLFATTAGGGDAVEAWFGAMEAQARATAAALGGARFARAAVGGGTPTFLDPAQWHRLCDLFEQGLGADLRAVPFGVEASPDTVDAARVRALRERGVNRVSIGVQSFQPDAVAALGRPQQASRVEEALDAIRAGGFETLNIDLIYGAAGQTIAGWIASIDAALRWSPEEIFLYPLYVRPLTGLGRRAGAPEDGHRLALYRAGRARLLAAGYRQQSMRMFQHAGHAPPAGPAYRCQADGMVGLGAGARSYTRSLHYSSEWAVSAAGVQAVLRDWVEQPASAFALARHGIELDGDEQRRRWVIQSLLQAEGLDRAEFAAAFGSDVLAWCPALAELAPAGLAVVAPDRIRLTAAGLERSDAVGPWLWSDGVRARMAEYECR